MSFKNPARVVFVFLTFSLLSFSSSSQKLNVDSVEKVIRDTKYDSVRVDALQSLAAYMIKHQKKDSIGKIYLQQSLEISQKIGYTPGKAQYHLSMGNLASSRSDWSASIEAYQQMIDISPSIANDSIRKRILMMAYNNLGGIHNKNGDFSGSLENRLKALEILEKAAFVNSHSRSVVYLNVASDYRQLKLYGKAIEYLKKTKPFFSDIADWMKMEFYFEYYECYLAADSAIEAKVVLDSMANGIQHYNLTPFQVKDYALMHAKLSSNYYITQEINYPKSLELATEELRLARELGQDDNITDAYYQMGKTYLRMQQPAKAIASLTVAWDSAQSMGYDNVSRKVAELLQEAYAKNGNMKEAYQFSQKALELNNSIYDAEKTKELNFLEARFQSEKKGKEIAALTLTNTLQQLEVVRKNKALIVGSVIAGALLLVLGLLYRNNRQRRLIVEKDQLLKEEQIRFLERQQQVVSLQSMINGQESERSRIAKDLHDGLGGLFSTIKMHFSTLQHEKEELKTDTLFVKSYELINSASEDVRRIAHNMMPEVLIRMGLVQAIQELCNSISAGKLLQVTLQHYGMEKRLNSSTEIMLFRIMQELLNNIMKHAKATEAIIQFNKEGSRLSVIVEDNGRGFMLLENQDKNSAGLASVESRVTYLNGKLSIDSQKGVGTTVMMDFLIQESL